MAEQPLHNEQFLLQRISEGDQQAFATLYSHYLPRLYRYVHPFVKQSHEETEEILQDIFFKIWLKKETLPGLEDFEPFLLRMTRNRIIDVVRKNKQHASWLKHASGMAVSLAADPENDLVFKNYNQAAQDALRQMTYKRRQVFEWHTQHDKTLEEIGNEMGISRSAAKKHLHAATRLIKEALRQNGDWVGAVIVMLTNMHS